MKLQITLKSGKTYTGEGNGKVYPNGMVYISRPINGYITVTTETETFESQKKQVEIAKDDILKVVRL